MKVIVLVIMVFCTTMLFGLNSVYYNNRNLLYLHTSNSFRSNIMLKDDVKDYDSEIIGMNYLLDNQLSDFDRIALYAYSSFERSLIYNFSGVQFKYQYDKVFTTRYDNTFGFKYLRYLPLDLFLSVDLPFKFSLHTMPECDSDFYSKIKTDYEFALGLNKSERQISLYSGWKGFEKGFYASVFLKRGLFYSECCNKIASENMANYLGFQISRSFLLNRYDSMLKFEAEYLDQLNEESNFMYSIRDYPNEKWLSVKMTYATDLSRRFNINSGISFRSGMFDKNTESDIYGNVSIMKLEGEINYYLSSKVRIYGNFYGSKAFADQENITEKFETGLKMGISILFDINEFSNKLNGGTK